MARVRNPYRRPRPLRTAPLIRAVAWFFQEKLTARGRYLLMATMVLALMGLDTRRTQVFTLFAVAAGPLVVAWLLSLRRPPRAELECVMPERVTARTPVRVPWRLLSAEATPDVVVSFPHPYRDESVLRFTPRQSIVAAVPGEATESAVTVFIPRRGRFVVPGATIRRTDPLQLNGSSALELDDTVVFAYPQFWRMDSFSVPLGRRYQPGGIPLSSSTGDAIEFVGTRDYRQGDPLKNIHWRSWARRGEPVVKEYQEEYFCRIAVIIDTFLPPESPYTRGWFFGTDEMTPAQARFEASLSVVASVADWFSRSEYIVDILAAGPDVYEVSAGRGLAYLDNILDVLACLEPCPDPPFQAIGPQLFEKLQQITTVVAVLQDWDTSRQQFLRQVKALGTSVRAIVVRDGPTTEPWQGAAQDIGEFTQMSPQDIERLIAAERGAQAGART